MLWRNSPLATITPRTAARSMEKPVTVVTVVSPGAVEIGATPLGSFPARAASSVANKTVRTAEVRSRP